MTSTLPVLSELPSGYFIDESPRGILALHSEVARAVHETGYGPEHDGSLERSELSGRRPLFELTAGGERFVVRRFSHGGLMRWITGERYLDPERPFRELILSSYLRKAGILTPQVIAARAQPAFGVGWYLDLISRRVENALDLGFVLGLARAGKLDRDVKRSLLRATGSLVRRLHQHGCIHADLTPANMLVATDVLEGAPAKLWVIDLDQSVLREKPTSAEVMHNLRRLFRYVIRREKRHGRALSRTDFQRFVKAYEPEKERRRSIVRTIAAAHRRSRLIHSLGWFLEGRFGKRSDPRETSIA
ncbi:MAG: tRNA A-37 threonylcarbamoyl transferase component Bud32 [Planctomycetota bacterium]|jgi:tRNA A-37 threonylcarbamoyl transferase component Bud32